MPKIIIIVLVLLVSLSSCFKNDVKQISGHINVKPEYAVPIGSVLVYFENYLDRFSTLVPADTAILPDSIPVFSYENQLYIIPAILYHNSTEPFVFSALQTNSEAVSELMIRTNAINKVPANVICQVYFLDAGYLVLDSLYRTGPIIINAATVDEQGNVVRQSELWEFDTYFSEDQIQSLTNLAYIQITTQLALFNQGAVYTKYFSNQELWIQLGAKIKLNVFLDEL